MEVAEELARRLGRRPRFVQVAFTSIDQSVERGDFDIGMTGVEDTPARRAALSVSVPYFEFREVLTVRQADRDRFRTLEDLKGKRLGTLGGTIAYQLLLDASRTLAVEPVSYDDDVHPYEDLASGRLDGVVLDHILARRSARKVPGLVIQPAVLATSHYVIVLARRNSALRDQVDAALGGMMRDGTLERIFRKWDVWDEGQKKLFARVLAGEPRTPPSSVAVPVAAPSGSRLGTALRYLPALLKASLVTLGLSCMAMALAIAVGVAVATGRLYAGRVVSGLLAVYVEVVRGTPVLLQLFVLYYGLSSVVRLPAFVAALIGLGLNYAAYESEIYRGALLAVPRGQLEAARTLGFSELQTLRLVRGPQAFRIALAPMTNDFVALLKDSSLVSVITVVELTKATQIMAANVGSWAVPGLLCAALYLALSLPLSRLARHLEARWRMTA